MSDQVSSSHPTKRKRTGEETDAPPNDPPPVTRSSQFWFEDGSVIIQAESIQYRVHRSVLSLHSTVLKDCFQIPQPDGEPTVDSCPVLHLSDSATDIEHLFCLFYALYDTHDLHKPIPFAITSITIRLGRKYDLIRFVTDAMARLKHGFPNQLRKWDEVDLSEVFTETKGLLFDVINLAYEFSINSILPAAFLQLCQTYTLLEILQGEERDDKSMAVLSLQALQTCLVGRDKVVRALPRGISTFFIQDRAFQSPNCVQPACPGEFLDILFFFTDEEPFLRIAFPGSDSPWDFKDFSDSDLCDDCVKKGELQWTRFRIWLWNKLPLYFGSGPWSSLKDME
ncbi:hypothetical protein GALMADRAFT_224801 [Galerina marginata CBS 339.88]|uniref:BTB domain-containing protein n=1 Tax=Galerina marginata (strain CBS 339.88) TaxID=685588 RepID=A0A067T2S0_GALM3|nr:hypothetical protein GALMADRAFT_224801 [Galerina marginata CBS 339.88]